MYQGRSQNLREVPQNFTEVFNIDDVTANDVMQRNEHRKEKNKLEFIFKLPKLPNRYIIKFVSDYYEKLSLSENFELDS